MKNTWRLLLCMTLLAVTPLLHSCGSPPPAKVKTAYDVVMESGKIRCAYIPYPGSCIKDPNSKKLTGIFVEALEEVGKKLGLTIEWTEEVTWATAVEGLQKNRYDLVGTAVWPNSTLIKQADFTRPLYFSPLCAYVRAGDARWHADRIDLINFANITVSTIEDDAADTIVKHDFPLVNRIALPAKTSDVVATLDKLVNYKADVAVVEPYVAENYLIANPNTIVNLTVDKPLAVFPDVMMLPPGQSELKALLDNSLAELQNNGFIDELLDKYEPQKGLFYRVPLPYMTPRMMEQAKRARTRHQRFTTDEAKVDQLQSSENSKANNAQVKKSDGQSDQSNDKNDQAKSESAKSSDLKTDQAKSESAKSSDLKTDQTKSGSAKGSDLKNDQTKSGSARSSDLKTDQTKSEPSKTTK